MIWRRSPVMAPRLADTCCGRLVAPVDERMSEAVSLANSAQSGGELARSSAEIRDRFRPFFAVKDLVGEARPLVDAAAALRASAIVPWPRRRRDRR